MSTRKRRPNTIQKERVKDTRNHTKRNSSEASNIQERKGVSNPQLRKKNCENAPVYNNRNNGLYYYELLESLDSSQSQRKDLCLTNPFFIVNFYSKKDRKTWVLSFFL